jgi:hypothetical protein
LVLSPTGSINLGFATEGRLAVVLIITFSWGFQLAVIYKTPTSTPHHHPTYPSFFNGWIHALFPIFRAFPVLHGLYSQSLGNSPLALAKGIPHFWGLNLIPVLEQSIIYT